MNQIPFQLPIVRRWVMISALGGMVCSYSYFSHYKPLPVIAFSLDYHGCLGNERYQKHYTQLMPLIAKEDTKIQEELKRALLSYSNLKLTHFIIQTLYGTLKKDSTQKSLFILLNGSNRQFQTNSSYPLESIEYFKDSPLPLAINVSENFLGYIRTLLDSHAISWSIDPFLLGDAYSKKQPGYTWDKAKQSEHNTHQLRTSQQIPKNQMDRDKFDIVYGQIHRLSHEYCQHDKIGRKQNLHFYFLDDNEKILNNLSEFFKKNSDLLPSHAQLFLIQYTGETITFRASIQGKGITDQHYLESIYYSYDHFKNEIKDGRLYKTQILSNRNNLEAFKNWRAGLQHELPASTQLRNCR